jgi:Ca2+-binding EF-hand superfamily protein
MKLCVILLSSSHEYNSYLADFLLNCLLSDEILLTEYLSLGILDGLFNLFLKFKQNSNPSLAQVFGDTGGVGGPMYSISLVDSILIKLFQLLKQNLLGHVVIFHTKHFEIMEQLYSIICQELKKGSLRYSPELQDLTDHLFLFFQEIINGYGLLSSSSGASSTSNSETSSSSSLLVFEFLKQEYFSLFENWNEVLATSHQEGLLAIKRSIDMDIASGGSDGGEGRSDLNMIHPLLRNGVVSSNDLLITAIPLWTNPNTSRNQQQQPQTCTVTVPLEVTMDSLRNGFSSLYQMDLILYYESDEVTSGSNGGVKGKGQGKGGKTMVPLIQRRELDQLIERTVTTQQLLPHQPPHSSAPHFVPTTAITIYLNKNTNSSFNTHHSPLTFQNSGLMNDHKNQMIFELKQTCDLLHKKIHVKLIEKFYDYFAHHSSGNGEINKTQFIAILLSLDSSSSSPSSSSSFTEQDGEYIFNAFDDDGNGMLSLHEICIGFSKLLSGTLDDKLSILFYSYDLDRNHKLDLEELTSMIFISNHHQFSLQQARDIAIAAGNRYDANHDNVLDFKEFKEAYYAGCIPLGFNWSSSSAFSSPSSFPSSSSSSVVRQRNGKNNPFNHLQGADGGNHNNSGSGQQSSGNKILNGFSNLKKGFLNQQKPQIQTQFPSGQQSHSSHPPPHSSPSMKKPLTLDALLQNHQQQPQQQSRGGNKNRHEIRRAFSLDADAGENDDDGAGPPPHGSPVLSRQAGKGGGAGSLPIPKLTRGAGKAQDDSGLYHQSRRNK